MHSPSSPPPRLPPLPISYVGSDGVFCVVSVNFKPLFPGISSATLQARLTACTEQPSPIGIGAVVTSTAAGGACVVIGAQHMNAEEVVMRQACGINWETCLPMSFKDTKYSGNCPCLTFASLIGIVVGNIFCRVCGIALWLRAKVSAAFALELFAYELPLGGAG